MGGTLQCLLVASLCLIATGQTSSDVAPNPQFYCNTGYSVRDCELHLKRLRSALERLDLAPLGDWTWILVRSQHWKPILRRVGRDPDSPAFTILEKRQTFLEEALFHASPDRSRTLLERWRIPLDQLLELRSPMSSVMPCAMRATKRERSNTPLS